MSANVRIPRIRVFTLIGIIWFAGLAALLAGGAMWPVVEPTIEVVHWSNGHLVRTGSGLHLLPQMAEAFNKDRHRTESGKRIKVNVIYHGSWEQANDLLSRVARSVPVDRDKANPTLVTPSASHWLVRTNHLAGRTVVDIDRAPGIARTMIGIVTYREMAECLGWPEKAIGYADVLALRDDPRGWGSLPCARAEWGQRPLVAYTDPTTSDTGRGVLLSLYSMASGVPPERLAMADVTRPDVVAEVKRFQGLVDHYLIATRVLNTKVHQGPRYGHFFLMPEDNLIHLYEGTEPYFDPKTGSKGTAPPITRPMVMIYPKEGAIPRDNCACLVNAPWVTPEHREAAEKWVAHLREDAQQRAFMVAGFRPATGLPAADPVSPRYGLDPREPALILQPERIDAAVAAAIDGAWEDVKRPGIVTLVVDTSGSMSGEKIKKAREGAVRALDNMAKHNQVGLVTFSDRVNVKVPVAPLVENKFRIVEAVQTLKANGGTALYEGLKEAIRMTDSAPGDPSAIRAVVLLTDGVATQCGTALHDLVRMISAYEAPIVRFRGCDNDSLIEEASADLLHARRVTKEQVNGAGLAIETRHPVQIFFIGIGRDADMQIGRILAEASGAEFQGATEKDFANVLEEFSKYF